MRLKIDRDSLKMVLVLTIIAAISALLLSAINLLTYISDDDAFAAKIDYDSPISKYYSAEIAAYVNLENTQIKNAVSFEDGAVAVVAHSKKAYSGKGLSLFIIFKDSKILSVTSFSNSETPSIGSEALGHDSYLYQYEGLSIERFSRGAINSSVDALSGATKSSDGVRLAVNAAAVFYKEVVQHG